MPEPPEVEDILVSLADESGEPFSPEIVLFLDGSAESEQARRLLMDTGKRFRLHAAAGPRIPAAAFGGVVAEKLAGVRDLLGALDAFESTILRGRAEVSDEPSAPSVLGSGGEAHHGPRQ